MHVEHDLGFLPRRHVGEVGLLEVGFEPGPAVRDQREQRRLRLDLLAELKPEIDDDAGLRRLDLGIGKVYEAAESDGAGPIARFWYITLPLLTPVLAVVILFSTIFTLSDFNIVYVLTRGGPMNMTHLFATYSFALGLQGGQIGQGAAVSLFLFPILLAVVFVQLRLVRKAALYE